MPFTTTAGTACSPPSGVSIGGITATGATFNWNSIAAATGYEYAVDQSGTPPASGTAVTTNTAPATGLISNTQYFLHVRTNCGSSYSSWYTTYFYTSASSSCNAPSNISLNTVTSGAANFSFSSVAGALSYEYAVDQNVSSPGSGTVITGTSVAASGLNPSTAYYLHIRSNCAGGINSAWSTFPFNTTAAPCNAPAGLAVSGLTPTSANFSWSGVAGAIVYEYEVTQSATPPGVAGIVTTSISGSSSTLVASTSYWLHVRTQCAGSTMSGWASYSFTTPAAPVACAAPLNLTSSAVGSGTASISWTAVAAATGYEYVLSNSSANPPGGGTPTTITTLPLSSLTASTTYYLHVRSVCGPGITSPWVNTSFTTAATAPSCPAPVNLNISGVTPTGATAGWNPVSGATGYEYVLSNSSAAPTGSGTAVAGTSVLLSGLTAGTSYYVHIRAQCGPTDFSLWVVSGFATPPAPCLPPTGLLSSSINSTNAIISWAPVAGAVSYEYAVNTSATPPATGTFTTATSVTVNSLLPGTKYYFHVRARCGATNYSPWATSNFTTNVAGSCNAPATLTVTNISASGASLAWASQSGILAYEYVVKTSPVPPTSGSVVTTTSASASGLASNTDYYLFVRAKCNATVNSGWSTKLFHTAVSTGVGKLDNEGIHIEIFPNPVRDKLSVKLSQGSPNGKVTLVDLSGKLVCSYTIDGTETEIDLANLSAGTYFLKFQSSKASTALRIIKQ